MPLAAGPWCPEADISLIVSGAGSPLTMDFSGAGIHPSRDCDPGIHSQGLGKTSEVELYHGGSSLPPITTLPLTPHQDFAERNGFCTRPFFIIKLTVSTHLELTLPPSWGGNSPFPEGPRAVVGLLVCGAVVGSLGTAASLLMCCWVLTSQASGLHCC